MALSYETVCSSCSLPEVPRGREGFGKMNVRTSRLEFQNVICSGQFFERAGRFPRPTCRPVVSVACRVHIGFKKYTYVDGKRPRWSDRRVNCTGRLQKHFDITSAKPDLEFTSSDSFTIAVPAGTSLQQYYWRGLLCSPTHPRRASSSPPPHLLPTQIKLGGENAETQPRRGGSSVSTNRFTSSTHVSHVASLRTAPTDTASR